MARGDQVTFIQGYSLAVVQVTLNAAYDLDLLADTGSELTVVSVLAARRAGINLEKPRRTISLVGVGHTARVPIVRIDQLQVGGHIARGVDVAVYDPHH